MKYLAHGPELIQPITQIHPSLQKAFLAFLLNDGYLIEKMDKKRIVIHMIHPKRDRITIEKGKTPNDAARKRYLVFLKMYAKHGKEFIAQLSAQIRFKKF